MLGFLFPGGHSASPAWASGGGGAKEGEGAEAVLEATRRPAPVVDPLDVLVSEAAVRAKDGGEEKEVERHGEPVVTPLTLALAPEEGAPKGEGAEKPDAEIKRRLELTAPRPPAEDEAKGKKKGGEGEGEAPPVEVEMTRHPEAVVSKLAALLDKIEPPKGGEGEAGPPEVEMERHEEPVIDSVSLAFTKAAARTKPAGEGEGGAGGVVEFERHPQPFFEKESALEARLKNKDKKEGEAEVEAEFTRHPELEVDDTAIAIATAEGGNKGEGGSVEVEIPRKPGPVVDEVDAALDKSGGKPKGEGAEEATDIARKPEPVASESEIPGLESAKEEARDPDPKGEPRVADASPAPGHGQLFTPHGVIGEKPVAVPEAHAGKQAELAKKWPGRDLSTPAKRLIGHWTFRLGSVQGDYWFAPLDPRSGRGGLVVNDQGTLRRGSWRLVKDDPKDQAVTVSSTLLAADPFTFPIPEHGATLTEVYSPESALTLEYADQGTAPGVAGRRKAGMPPQGARPRRDAVARRTSPSRHE